MIMLNPSGAYGTVTASSNNIPSVCAVLRKSSFRQKQQPNSSVRYGSASSHACGAFCDSGPALFSQRIVALFKATSRQSTGVLELAMRIKDTEMFGLYTPAANGTQVAALVLTLSNSKNLPRILDSGGKDF